MIIETRRFAAQAGRITNVVERDEPSDFIPRSPKARSVVLGTGGVRKLRVAIQGKNRRGGVRVIYYRHTDHNPVLVFTVFEKNEI